MIVRRDSLEFKNVLGKKVRMFLSDWDKESKEFRDSVIKNNLFQTGPIIYKLKVIEEERGLVDYELYMPLNARLRVPEGGNYTFYENFIFEDVLILRHENIEDDISESQNILKECARENSIKIEDDFYNILVDLYGEQIIDLCAKVKRSEYEWL